MVSTERFALPAPLAATAEKVIAGERLTEEEGLALYETNQLALLGLLATHRREKINGNLVFFNRNFHIEPTNICVNRCRFCSYRREAGHPGAWEYSIADMVEMVREQLPKGPTEVHIVGGVHPGRDLYFYRDLLLAIRSVAPGLTIKAFTAVEIEAMCALAGLPVMRGLELLRDAGLGSLPGGGAEIFDETLRAEICPGKTSAEQWLAIHETAHTLGIPTNATMLYGLRESYRHRIDHLSRLRSLQDRTGGFNAFIPLKFRRANNRYSTLREISVTEEMKNYAVSRLFLDNIPHLKAYWPMTGKPAARLSLHFGVDDLDGTIDDSTRIYSMAGAEERNPSASTAELAELVRDAGYLPAERDTFYSVLRTY